jgi:hypothetical protein
MAFKLKQSNSYFTPISVDVPADGGKFVRQSFEAEFRRPDRDELMGLFERIRKAAENGKNIDAEIVREVLVGWRGIEDEDGHPLPFTDAHRDALLNHVQAVPALIGAFFETQHKAREKN